MLSKPTVERLVVYNRILKKLDREGQKWITSKKIADVLSRTSAQVRRDLSFLGKKGKTGVGYKIKDLIKELDKVLGLNTEWGLVLIGAGNLGRALFYYPGFRREGFEFRVVIDSDPKKIGKKWSGVTIKSIEKLKKSIDKKDVCIALLAVPAGAAQKVTEDLVDAGIKEILNFAPVTLNVPEDVNVRYVDLALELENISCNIVNKSK